MKQINNDAEFKQALQGLDSAQQRLLAAHFVEHVLALSQDKRLQNVVRIAHNREASATELLQALQSARSATLDSHARCGSEGHWGEQAGYFVARAAMAAVTPHLKSGAAWQAAMSCRMACTSILIDDETKVSTHAESAWQYQKLSDYLNEQ